MLGPEKPPLFARKGDRVVKVVAPALRSAAGQRNVIDENLMVGTTPLTNTTHTLSNAVSNG